MTGSLGTRIAMIGIGKVGAAAVYSIIHRNIASEILILDTRPEFEDAQVQDLRDSTSFGVSPRVRSATWKECGQADLVVFTAGTNQKGGESRLALVQRNFEVVRKGIEAMKPFGLTTILLMVTNPVDIMTYFAVKYSGLPAQRVFGSGTILDTTRLKDALAQRAAVAPRAVSAYVVGEHGDSQTIAWSSAAIGGISLSQWLPELMSSQKEKAELADWIRFQADRLNKAKGETSFGIGSAVATIATAVLLDERNVMPISHWKEECGVCFNWPAVVGRGGIYRTMDVPLDPREREALERSIAKIQDVVASTEKTVGRQVQSMRFVGANL